MIKIIENNFLENIPKREVEDVRAYVQKIIDDVRQRGDLALNEYTKKFDKIQIGNTLIDKSEINNAYRAVDKNLIKALKVAKKNIVSFNKKGVQKSFSKGGSDSKTGTLVRPFERIGIYVPGGNAVLMSTVMMLALPAKVAGVKEIVMVSPPNIEGNLSNEVLAAAKLSGVTEIHKVGGPQAIGALAYGTESIKKVDKIFGPGNVYVQTAKQLVFGDVAIDLIAGPSEVVIISDNYGNDKYIVSDLLAQSEHDKMAMSILITTSKPLATRVINDINTEISRSDNFNLKMAVENNLRVFLVKNIDEAISLSNAIAPEHLELHINGIEKIYNKLLKMITNAGAVFLGEMTPESVGDYIAGPNHTLPTGGSARFFSALSVTDYFKKTNFIYYSKEAIEKNADDIISIADAENLKYHAKAVRDRK